MDRLVILIALRGHALARDAPTSPHRKVPWVATHPSSKHTIRADRSRASDTVEMSIALVATVSRYWGFIILMLRILATIPFERAIGSCKPWASSILRMLMVRAPIVS